MNAPLRTGPKPEVMQLATFRRRIELTAAIDELATIAKWGHQFDDDARLEMREAAKRLMEMAQC